MVDSFGKVSMEYEIVLTHNPSITRNIAQQSNKITALLANIEQLILFNQK